MTEHHEQLILKLLDGTITSEERSVLNGWMGESEENKKLVNDFVWMWKASGTKVEVSDFQTAEEWAKLEKSMDAPQQARAREIKFFSYATALKVAASISAIILLAWVFYSVGFNHKTILKESGGTMVQLALPDGSHVWLNKQSSLSYDDNFNSKDRTVQLSGEAFFEVKPDSQKPFVVLTNGARVKVLGTSFNVRLNEKSHNTEVFVVTGLVSFANVKNEEAGIKLRPGESAATNGNAVAMLENEDSNILAWKEKRLVFKKSSLSTVFENLEKYFKVDMKVKNNDINRCRFTGSFDQPTLEEIIEALNVSLDLTIIKKDGIYIVDGDGC